MASSHHILVTIGIPTYNRADSYLRQALQSAVRQNYAPLEIIVSDNCSTDDTEAVVRSFADPRIHYYRQPANLDPNSNFNFCLEKAGGEFFLLLHDDDVIDADFIQACMDAVGSDREVGVVITGTRVIDANNHILKTNPNWLGRTSYEAFIQGWLEHRVALYLCNTLYNTQHLKALKGFHSRHNLYQDVVATMHLAARYGQIHVTEVKASFRLHGKNRGDSAGVMNWCRDCQELMKTMTDLLPRRNTHIERLAATFFSNQCYGFAQHISNPLLRLLTYHRIYQAFGFRCSPRRLLRKHEFPLLKKAIVNYTASLRS